TRLQGDWSSDVCSSDLNAEGESLRDLVVVNMDEYLAPDGREWIPESDPLSFRRHMRAHFYDLLDPALAPPPAQRLFPDPRASDEIGRASCRERVYISVD